MEPKKQSNKIQTGNENKIEISKYFDENKKSYISKIKEQAYTVLKKNKKNYNVNVIEKILSDWLFNSELLYHGDWAWMYQKMVHGKEYRVYKEEMKCLKDHIDNIKPYINGWNYDIGIGDWEKLYMIMKKLQDKKINYVGIDNSKQMLELAQDKIGKLSNVKSEFVAEDFFDVVVDKWHDYKKQQKTIRFLWWSFGNIVKKEDQEKFLSQISDNMTKNDTFIISLFISPKNKEEEKNVIDMYDIPWVADRFVFSGFEKLWFNKNELKYSVEFEDNSVKIYVTTLVDQHINIWRKQQVIIPKGKKILAHISKRFTDIEIEEMFKKADLYIKKRIDSKWVCIFIVQK